MSAGILEHDRGIVCGERPTWHGIPSYIHKTEDWATAAEAREILDYPIEKRQLTRTVTHEDGSILTVPADAWEIIRTDIQPEIVLVPAVGKKFDVINNAIIMDEVEKSILSKHPELKIESVGTLFNGQIAFVSMRLAEWKYKGDPSNTEARLMYYNPLGLGKYKIGCHTIRIECFNTLSTAQAQSNLNRTAREREPHQEC